MGTRESLLAHLAAARKIGRGISTRYARLERNPPPDWSEDEVDGQLACLGMSGDYLDELDIPRLELLVREAYRESDALSTANAALHADVAAANEQIPALMQERDAAQERAAYLQRDLEALTGRVRDIEYKGAQRILTLEQELETARRRLEEHATRDLPTTRSTRTAPEERPVYALTTGDKQAISKARPENLPATVERRGLDPDEVHRYLTDTGRCTVGRDELFSASVRPKTPAAGQAEEQDLDSLLSTLDERRRNILRRRTEKITRGIIYRSEVKRIANEQAPYDVAVAFIEHELNLPVKDDPTLDNEQKRALGDLYRNEGIVSIDDLAERTGTSEYRVAEYFKAQLSVAKSAKILPPYTRKGMEVASRQAPSRTMPAARRPAVTKGTTSPPGRAEDAALRERLTPAQWTIYERAIAAEIPREALAGYTGISASVLFGTAESPAAPARTIVPEITLPFGHYSDHLSSRIQSTGGIDALARRLGQNGNTLQQALYGVRPISPSTVRSVYEHLKVPQEHRVPLPE